MEKYLNMVFLRISSEYRDLHVDGSVLHELPTGFNTPKETHFRSIRCSPMTKWRYDHDKNGGTTRRDRHRAEECKARALDST